MASIIKNQILKHLSKFTKNLSPDKIQLSTFKGEGNLNNLELDENVLMELLDLPTWLRLVKATCNKVSIKVQWTKLKSQPICLYLDEVVVEMETCSEPRTPAGAGSGKPSYSSGGKYGFAERVIDGLFLSVNSVVVNFKSTTFQASIQMSRLKVQSTSPLWKTVNDLRMTRIRDPDRGMLLTFKEIEWQTLRVEANAIVSDDPTLATTPLRLISNMSRLRIVLKKKVSDCSVVSSKLSVILDDLLWVLTDTQMKAAILFAKSLKGIIDKSAEQSKDMAAIKLQKQASESEQTHTTTHHHHQGTGAQTKVAQLFTRFDVEETSYHMYTGRIDLHICDETGPQATSSGHSRLVDGGAMQITFYKFSFEHYPYHPAGGSRKHWLHYNENMAARNDWASKLMVDFRKKVHMAAKGSPNVTSPNQSPQHVVKTDVTDSDPSGVRDQLPNGLPKVSQPVNRPKSTKLIERCFIVRLEDFTMFRVSTADNKRNTPKKFLASDKKSLYLPPEMSAFHAEYTDYFFPKNINYPVPHGNLYVMVNPIRLAVDYLTVLWLNSFSLGMAQNIEIPESVEPAEHIDIKVEALMPRVILPSEKETTDQERPNGLQIQASRLTITNCRVEDASSVLRLATVLENLQEKQVFSPDFCTDKNSLIVIPKNFEQHLENERTGFSSLCNSTELASRLVKPIELNQKSLKLKAYSDVWSVCAEQFWLDFLGTPSLGRRPAPFVESFPLTIWLCKPAEEAQRAEECKRKMNTANVVSEKSENSAILSSPERNRHRKLLSEYYTSNDDDGAVKNDSNESACHSLDEEIAQTVVKCDSLPDTSVNQVGDIQLLVSLESQVQCQLNHFQYLFLLRLLESVAELQKQLDLDSRQFIGETSSGLKVSAAIALQEVELSLLSPPDLVKIKPVGASNDLSSPGEVSDIQPDSTGSSCEPSPVHEVPAGNIDPVAVGGGIDRTDLDDTLVSPTTPPSILLSDSAKMQSQENDASQSISNEIDGTSESSGEQNVNHTRNGSDQLQFSESVDDSKIFLFKDGSVSMSFKSDSIGSPGERNPSPKSLNILSSSNLKGSFPAERKRSFTDLKLSAKSKIENIFGRSSSGQDDDNSDSQSIRSSLSDDEDEYVMIGLESMSVTSASTMGSTTSPKELADGSSITSLSSSQERGKEKVNVDTFKVKGIQTIFQVVGADTTVTIHGSEVLPVHRGNIYLEDVHERTPPGNFMNGVTPEHTDSPLKVNFKIGPAADLLVAGAGERGHLDVKVNDLSLHFMMTSLMNIAELLEDETIPEAIPMHVEVANIKLRLEDNRPPANPTSPTPVPIDVHVHKNVIARTFDGAFHISSDVINNSEDSSFSKICNLESRLDTLSKENISLKDSVHNLSEANSKLNCDLTILKESLAILEQSSAISDESTASPQPEPDEKMNADDNESNHKVEDYEQLSTCNNELAAKVLQQQDEILNLRSERESLMVTLQLLQDELINSERMRMNKAHS